MQSEPTIKINQLLSNCTNNFVVESRLIKQSNEMIGFLITSSNLHRNTVQFKKRISMEVENLIYHNGRRSVWQNISNECRACLSGSNH